MKIAYFKTVLGSCYHIDYSDTMLVSNFLEEAFAKISSPLVGKAIGKDGVIPADALVTDFHFLSTSSNPGIFLDSDAYKDKQMGIVPTEPGSEDVERLQIHVLFSPCAYQARKKAEHTAAKVAFLGGLQARLGKDSSLLSLSRSSHFERRLFPLIFSFFAPKESKENSTPTVKPLEMPSSSHPLCANTA